MPQRCGLGVCATGLKGCTHFCPAAGAQMGQFPPFSCLYRPEGSGWRDLRPALPSARPAWGFSGEEMAPNTSRSPGLWGRAVPRAPCCGVALWVATAVPALHGQLGTIPVPTNPCPAGTASMDCPSPAPSPPSPNLPHPSPAALAVVPHLWRSAAPRGQRGGSAGWAPGPPHSGLQGDARAVPCRNCCGLAQPAPPTAGPSSRPTLWSPSLSHPLSCPFPGMTLSRLCCVLSLSQVLHSFGLNWGTTG